MTRTLALLGGQVRDLYTTVVLSQGSTSPLARMFEVAIAAGDSEALQHAVSAWLALPHRQTHRMLRRVAMIHAPVIRAGFQTARSAAVSLLGLVRHPEFDRLLHAARVLERLSNDSHPLSLATATRAFVEASKALGAAELPTRLSLFVPPPNRLPELH